MFSICVRSVFIDFRSLILKKCFKWGRGRDKGERDDCTRTTIKKGKKVF